MTEKRQTGLSPKQIQNLYRGVEIVLIVASFWLALVNQVNLLLAQAIFILISFLDNYFLHNRTKKTDHRWDFAWLIICSFLITLLLSKFYLAPEINDYKTFSGILISISMIALAAKLILVLGIRKTALKMEFFKSEAPWIIVLIVGITILFTKFVILDLAGAAGFLIYLLVQNLTNLDQTLPTKGSQITFENKHESEELDQQIIDEILEIPKIEKIYDLKIISPDGQKTIIGNLVVNNHSSQEDIYNIKQKAKKILKNNGLDESILETEYLAEFNERDEIKEKPEIQT